jgi:hypothetical protein
MNGWPVAARDTASRELDSLAIPGDQHPEWIWRNGGIVPSGQPFQPDHRSLTIPEENDDQSRPKL